MNDPYRDDPVATMFADLDNKEMHGINCGRGDLSANPDHHYHKPAFSSSTGAAATVKASREPVDGDKIGFWFCACWIGVAAKSWWAFGGFIAVALVIVVFMEIFLKGDSKEIFYRKLSYSIFSLSMIGVIYCCYLPWGWMGVAYAVSIMAALAAIYFFCRTRLAKVAGTLIVKGCKLTFYTAFIGFSLYSLSLLILDQFK